MGCGTAPCVVAGCGEWEMAIGCSTFPGAGRAWLGGGCGVWVDRVSRSWGAGIAAAERQRGSGGEDLQQVCFGCLGEEERRT